MSTQQPSPTLSLVQETAIERGETNDMIFTAEQWERFDHHFKRRLAGAADSNEISGRSTMLELRSFFVCQRTLGEYAED